MFKPLDMKTEVLIELESVGSVINPTEAVVYPLLENGSIDWDCGVPINEVTDEWFEALSSYDVNQLIEAGIYEILK
jgi:hypothetical protein